eukprot:scpid37149/ scgid29532/ 
MRLVAILLCNLVASCLGVCTFPHLAPSDHALGIVNVVTAYHADPTGKSDSTEQLQAAIDYARENRLTVYVPIGTYVVTESLNCSEHNSGRFKPVVIVGEKPAGRLSGRISSAVKRPEIVLPASTPGFTNPKWPRYVVHYFENDALPPSNSTSRINTHDDVIQAGNGHDDASKKKGHFRTNVNFNQVFQGVNIRVGAGNHGAIGIRLRGAQGSSMEDCTIDMGPDGFIGAEGASGSGGSHKGVTVIGGRYGLDFRFAQPAPTVTTVHLINQTCSAMIYAGHETLTAVGVHVESYVSHDPSASKLGLIASVPAEYGDVRMPWLPVHGPCAIPVLWPVIQAPNPLFDGQMSILDSIIETNQKSKSAITTARDLYLRNVFVRGVNNLAEFRRGNYSGPHDILANPTTSAQNWTHIDEAAIAIQPPHGDVVVNGSKVDLQYQSRVWWNDRVDAQNLTKLEKISAPPPDNLTIQHLYDELEFPSFQSANAVSVIMPPYNVIPDGQHDVTAMIQKAIDDNEIVLLPKGYYRVSSTLKLRSNTKLVGIGRTFTLIVIPKDGISSSTGQTQPIIETPVGIGSVVIAYMTVTSWHDINNTYALLWQTYGVGCYYRQGFLFTSYYTADPDKIYLSDPDLWPAGAPRPEVQTNTTHPLIVITGGGQFYDLENEDCIGESPSYRHLLITNSTQGLRFYQLNMEHGRGDANTEVINSKNVQIYGLKSEGNFVALWIRNSVGVSLYGYGGNAAAFPLAQKYPPGYTQLTPSLFRVDNNQDLRLCNLRDTSRVSGGNQTFFAGQGYDPHHWVMVYDVHNDQYTPPMVRPVLFYQT